MGIFTGLFTGGTSGAVEGGLKGIGDIADGIISKFKADPTKVAELKEDIQQAMMADRMEMEKIAEAKYEAQLKDIEDARNMQIKLNQSAMASWLSKNINPLLALFVSLIWGAMTVYLVLRMLNFIAANPNVNMTAVLGVYSAISGTMGILMNFYFGSSHSSQSKDETIATIAKQP